MATNVFKGREGKIQVAGTSVTTGTNFGAVRNFTVNVTRGEISVANFDSSGWDIRLDGIASWSFSAETVFLSTAATVNEQDTLRAAALAGTRKYFVFGNSTGTDSQTFKGWGYITGWDWSGAVDGPQLINFSITGDGKIVES